MNNPEQSKVIKRVSVASDGTQANGYSGSNSLSDDGRYILFESNATNLISNDFNGHTDTFIYDRLEETVELVSINSNGTQANGSSGSGFISGNGRYVTYASFASNLVSKDTNSQQDIFVYDRQNKKTELISVASDNTQANGMSSFSLISEDGRYVVFESMADNLVSGDTNNLSDIFIRDRQEGTTERINLASNGIQANGTTILDSISEDGRYVSFISEADNLLSARDTNNLSDIFVYDRQTGTTERINLAPNGAQANGASSSSDLSADGRYVVYQSDASNLVSNDTNGKRDIFIYDRIEQTTARVDVADDETQSNVDSQSASISDDGRYVAFASNSNSDGDSQVFLRDRIEQTTVKVEADSFPTISGNGEYILFNSSLDSVVSNDTNEAGDVFLLQANDLDTDEPNEPNVNRFNTKDVHRFYQPNIGSHLYTTDVNEIKYVREQSAEGNLSYQYEAEKFAVLADNKDALTGEAIEGVKPVYRFFNTHTGAHLYTMDENEKSFIEANLSHYSFEGVKYHAFETEPADIETIPVYRLLNGDSGSHLYTIDQNELNYIQEKLPNFTLENNGEPTYHVFEL